VGKPLLVSILGINPKVYLFSSETVSFFLPVALLLDNTFLPFLVDMRSLKPCLFLRFLTDGWNVLFIAFYFGGAKIQLFFKLKIKN
jgi:hypothetical protein